MKCEPAIVRNSPWSGGPDDRRYVTADFRGLVLAASNHRKLHPDRWAHVIFVLNLRFRQRRGIEQTPVDGLASAVHVAFLHEIEKRIGDRRLIIEAHGEVWIVPSSENTEPLEIFFVLFDVARREFPAQFAKLRRRNFAFSAKLFFHLRLDRQTVAIPSGNVRSVI